MKNYFVGKGQGMSMEPMINEGDNLYVEKTRLKDIKIGDIVVFYRNKNFIGHRVLKIKENYIFAKGDNSLFFDKPLKSDEILGKIVKIKGKYGILDFSSSYLRLATYYFLFYSLTTYYLPIWLRMMLVRIIRGRKILILLAQKLKL